MPPFKIYFYLNNPFIIPAKIEKKIIITKIIKIIAIIDNIIANVNAIGKAIINVTTYTGTNTINFNIDHKIPIIYTFSPLISS